MLGMHRYNKRYIFRYKRTQHHHASIAAGSPWTPPNTSEHAPPQPVCTHKRFFFTLYPNAALPWHLPRNTLSSQLLVNRTHKISLLVSTTSAFGGKELLAVRFEAARSYVSSLIKITWWIFIKRTENMSPRSLQVLWKLPWSLHHMQIRADYTKTKLFCSISHSPWAAAFPTLSLEQTLLPAL